MAPRPRIFVHVGLLTSALLALVFFVVVAEARSPQSTILPNRKLTAAAKANGDDNGASSGTVFNVEKYGAAGDGKQDDTQAFGSAWAAACKASGGATLQVPGGKSFLVNNLEFDGPCGGPLTFQVDGTIVAPENPGSWKSADVWLQFWKVEQLTLAGKGTIDGKGQQWWSANSGNRPTIVHFEATDGLTVSGLSFLDSPCFHITMSNSKDVKFQSLKVRAPYDSPNTDGIKVANSNNVLIKDTDIGTGDDCVALIQGSQNININNVKCGPGHGISIGSLGRDGADQSVTGVHVNGATLTGTDNGVRIKTYQGGSGVASDIIFENIQMNNVKNPIIIDQNYCNGRLSTQCATGTTAVQIKNVIFRKIKGTSGTKVAIDLECSTCSAITLEDVLLTLAPGAIQAKAGDKATSSCQNAQGKAIGTVVPPSCLA